MRAGAGQTNITPLIGTHLAGYFEDRIAADVDDELFAKAIVLDDGSTTVALVVCDVIVLPGSIVNAVREIVEASTGVPGENVLIAATHTHSGPATVGLLGTPCDNAYVETLPARIADSVRRALARMRPARWGVASASETGLTANRRFRRRDGSVRMGGRVDDPDIVEPVGPIDPNLSVLHVIDSGTLESIALLANFGLHYVGGMHSDHVSADYFGAFAQMVQRKRGESFVVALANGFCGDVNAAYFHQPISESPPNPVAHYADALATRVLGLVDDITYRDSLTLMCAHEALTIPLRPITDGMRIDAKAILGDRSPSASTYGYTWDEYYARELLLLDKMPREVRTEVQVITLDDVGIVGMPGEMFAQFGLDMSERSPLAPLFKIELANDYVGYVPTRKGLADGGYETLFARSSKLAPEAGEMLLDAAVRLLKRNGHAA